MIPESCQQSIDGRHLIHNGMLNAIGAVVICSYCEMWAHGDVKNNAD